MWLCSISSSIPIYHPDNVVSFHPSVVMLCAVQKVPCHPSRSLALYCLFTVCHWNDHLKWPFCWILTFAWCKYTIIFELNTLSFVHTRICIASNYTSRSCIRISDVTWNGGGQNVVTNSQSCVTLCVILSIQLRPTHYVYENSSSAI